MQTYDNNLTFKNTIDKVKTVERVAKNQNIVCQESAYSVKINKLNELIN